MEYVNETFSIVVIVECYYYIYATDESACYLEHVLLPVSSHYDPTHDHAHSPGSGETGKTQCGSRDDKHKREEESGVNGKSNSAPGRRN